MEELVKGSIEELPVEVHDRLGELITLDEVLVEFRVTDEDGVEEVAWTTCSNDGMKALPLIDTTDMDYTTHKLYVKVNAPPERPILGPFEFQVV